VPLRFGPFAGVIRTGERYGIAFPKGSELVDPVNDALGSLSSSGALARFERRWLTTNLAALPALR
jgi:ABC-type amino acid transport substrate-binding protein